MLLLLLLFCSPGARCQRGAVVPYQVHTILFLVTNVLFEKTMATAFGSFRVHGLVFGGFNNGSRESFPIPATPAAAAWVTCSFDASLHDGRATTKGTFSRCHFDTEAAQQEEWEREGSWSVPLTRKNVKFHVIQALPRISFSAGFLRPSHQSVRAEDTRANHGKYSIG